jgi:ribosomal protein L37AE/L43A
VKIKCPKCKGSAVLESDFSLVTCKKCNLEMSYGEYIKYVAHNDVTYSDILGDYAGSTEGQSAGTLDEWD